MNSHVKIGLSFLPFLLVFSGCTTISPIASKATAISKRPVFSHERFDRVLKRYGSPSGRIDYAALQKNPHDLEHYYRQITSVSPDSHPDLFPGNDHKLAYWINAYNAAAIKTVLAHYPIDSVKDVKPPAVFFFMPDLSGFFVFQKSIFGGRKISLYSLENSIVRKRFADPRIHFALNCAALGCPRLPQTAFSGDMLDTQLDSETRRFVAEERNFRIDHEKQTVYLSSIFKWYQEDYLIWLEQNDPGRAASLTRYIALYLPAEMADKLRAVENDYALQFLPYDWKLNDLR